MNLIKVFYSFFDDTISSFSNSLKSRIRITMRSKYLTSNFSYLVAIVIFLFVLVSLQKTFAQTPSLTEPAPAPANVAPVASESPKAETPQAPTTVETGAPAAATPAVSATEAQKNSQSVTHEVIRRVVVFPLHTDGSYHKEADLAWWKIREFLSDQQRFLVATKRYMQQNEVFQPRKTLQISDVVLLARILESDCLITTYLEGKKLTMIAYSAIDGLPLWKKSIDITASKPISLQLEGLSEKLIQDFLAALPYQGFQIVDPLNQEPIVEDGSTDLARMDVGARSSAAPGQKVQWLEIERSNPNPLFQGGSKIRVIAEGEVLKNENQVVTIEVKRAKDIKSLDKKSLISIPDEFKRIGDTYALRNAKDIQPNLTLLVEPMVDAREQVEETRPLLVALSAIANVVVALLLAL